MTFKCLTVIFILAVWQAQLSSAQNRYLVDMRGSGCLGQDYLVGDDDIYTLYATYNINQQPTMDHCDVSLRTKVANRRLRIYVQKWTIFDCGIMLYIYDNPDITVTPKKVLSCKDNIKTPLEDISSHGVLMISLRKQTASSSAFEFQILIATDFGPSLDFEKAASEFFEAPLDPGAVAGIAIAGVILVIALIGIAIYCCLKTRKDNLKYNSSEASHRTSAPTVFTTESNQRDYSNSQRKSKYGSTEDVHSTSSSTEKANNAFSNKAYAVDEDEKRSYRQNSYPRREKSSGGHNNKAFDEDSTDMRNTHVSRRDSHRDDDKKKNFTLSEQYPMSKVNKTPINGILKTRARSPNRSQSSTESSAPDATALVYGYSHASQAHPNTQHIPVIERKPRSRSRGTRSNRSSSTGRSSSVGHSASKSMDKEPKSSRQYADMSQFLKDNKSHRSRSRSGSVNRRSRSDSRTSEAAPPSEISFSSSKKTGGKRVHIRGVESDI